MFALIHDIVMIPLQVFEIPDSAPLQALRTVVTAYWSFDILMSMVTGIYVHGRLERRHCVIFKAYASTWMVFDITMVAADWASLVLEETKGTATGESDSLNMVTALRTGRIRRIMRFLRLLRVMKLKRVLDDLKSRANSTVVHFVFTVSQLILFTAFLAHVLACVWYALGDTEEGWLQAEQILGQPLGTRYVKSFQWSLARLHPIAMRDNMKLKTSAERIFSLVSSFGALLFSSVFIGAINNAMAKFQRLRRDKQRRLDAVSSYCATHGVSVRLAIQMKKYIEGHEERESHSQHHQSLKDALPTEMLQVLFHAGRTTLLTTHRLFMELREQYPSLESDCCYKALMEMHCLTGDMVFDYGHRCSGAYIIALGTLDYRLGQRLLFRRLRTGEESLDGNNLGSESSLSFWRASLGKARSLWNTTASGKKLERGEWLSEAALWVTSWRHAGHLQALSKSCLMFISAADLETCLQQHKLALEDTREYVQSFVEALNSKEEEVQSDIGTHFLPTLSGSFMRFKR
eukprot:TRINITY_DN18608_c0_g1_i6.p1 TRINITY_DN18608_c0_g1~~TRINITY_DN18608_c0_g1_i6.p1  ORF type:complete len:569 (-),score=96.03 TRINITY_DN18608_c0_g1_i6:44-1597(-)